MSCDFGVGDRVQGFVLDFRAATLAIGPAVVGKIGLIMQGIADRSHQTVAIVGNRRRIAQRIGDRREPYRCYSRIRHLPILIGDACQFPSQNRDYSLSSAEADR